jgi:membrane-anchored glycerophosphoryl diester phosphodiesterase (GDPDase)
MGFKSFYFIFIWTIIGEQIFQIGIMFCSILHLHITFSNQMLCAKGEKSKKNERKVLLLLQRTCSVLIFNIHSYHVLQESKVKKEVCEILQL